MRIWLQSSAKSSVFSPSTAFSLVAHAALIGGAVYGTGKAAATIEERITERVYYLPPPDRSASSAPSEEHVRYVPVGSGVDVKGDPSDEGIAVGREANEKPGTEISQLRDRSELTTPPAETGSDSVYSFLSLDESAVRVEGSGAPVYPTELKAKGVEGAVLARYVVDTSGRADPSSLDVLNSGADPLFVLSVRDALTEMRFRAAMVEGRKVRQLVEQSFVFRITPPVVPTTAAEHTRALPVP